MADRGASVFELNRSSVDARDSRRHGDSFRCLLTVLVGSDDTDYKFSIIRMTRQIAWHSRNHGNCKGACDSCRAQSPTGDHLSMACRAVGLGGDRRRLPGGHGRGGILCRHGHFGPLPIRIAWFGVALPALTLNYFGQGGLLLTEPGAVENSFFQLAPEWSHYGLVILATAATVIASQAIISGAYSLTSQAIQLGFLPRMNIVHTAGHEIGQIYVPVVNWALAFGTLAAVIGFGSSAALAGAFGIAVSLLMAITTLMATFVALRWKHNSFLVYSVNGSLLALDLLFVASTSTKLLDGGWFPLAISFVIAFLMLTWRKGQEILDTVRLEIREKSQEFIERIKVDPPHRIPGTAVILGRMTRGVPLSLTRNIKFNHVLHERVLLVAIEMTETPRVAEEDRVKITPISERITRVELRFGFMEKADVPKGLRVAVVRGQISECDLRQVTYFTGHEAIIPTGRKTGMARWRKAIFALMHLNAQRPGAYFNIPSAQVMEIGVEFDI